VEGYKGAYQDSLIGIGTAPLDDPMFRAAVTTDIAGRKDFNAVRLDRRLSTRLRRQGCTLPTVWIPPSDIRDKRELPRTRMVFGRERTRLKNRIHSVADKYGLQDTFGDISDIFGRKGREVLGSILGQLPSQTRYTAKLLLEQLDQTEQNIQAIEARMKELFKETEQHRLLETMPGVGFILAVVILQEVPDLSGSVVPSGSPRTVV